MAKNKKKSKNKEQEEEEEEKNVYSYILHRILPKLFNY
jgi:hypothetical protein